MTTDATKAAPCALCGQPPSPPRKVDIIVSVAVEAPALGDVGSGAREVAARALEYAADLIRAGSYGGVELRSDPDGMGTPGCELEVFVVGDPASEDAPDVEITDVEEAWE